MFIQNNDLGNMDHYTEVELIVNISSKCKRLNLKSKWLHVIDKNLTAHPLKIIEI